MNKSKFLCVFWVGFLSSILGFAEDKFSLSNAIRNNSKKIIVPAESDVNFQKRLCGINSLYLVISGLSGKSGADVYHELAAQFPRVEQEGMSLSQIHGYLEVKNFVCRFSELNEENISGLKENVFVFLLKEAEPISHIFLLRRKGKDYFQTIDTVGEVKMRTFDEIKNWKHFGLFVANDEKKLPQEKSFFEKHVLSASLCLAGLFFLVFSIKNWRKRDETKA